MKHLPTVTVAGLMAAVLVLLARDGAAPVAAATPSLPPNPAAAGVLTTSGQGLAHVSPDVVYLSVGASAQATTAAAAQSQLNDRVGQILKRAHDLGIADRDIRHSGYSLNPIYPPNSYGTPSSPSGFNANQQVIVTYREVAKAGRAVDALSGSDAGMHVSVSFGLENGKGAAEARAQAIAAARTQAVTMASAAGLKLGRIVGVSDGALVSTPRGAGFTTSAMADAGPSTPTTIPLGDVDVSAVVQVTFEIVPA